MLRGRSIGSDSNFLARRLGGASMYFAALAIAAALGNNPAASAATVTHNDDDAAAIANPATPEEHSFDGAFHWSDGGQPTAGNDYVVQSFLLRTNPAAGSYTFAGDSLSLVDGGQLRLRNAGAGDNITVNNLIMDAGVVRPNNANPGNLAGNITVTTNGATFSQFNSSNLYLNLTANISGATGGAVNFGGNDVYGVGTSAKRVTLTPSTANTYTGPTNVIGGNLRLGNASALPSGTTVYLGGGMTIPNTPSSNGSSVLDLNGLSISVAGVAVQSFTASTALLTGTQPSGGTVLTPPANTHSRVIRVSPITPGTVKVGQLVTAMFSTGTNASFANSSMVTSVYNDPGNAFTDITLGDNAQFSNVSANLTGLSFAATPVGLAAGQVIGNGSTTSDATLTLTASSQFDGVIVDAVAPDPNAGGTLGTRKTNIAFTANGGALTLTGANTYSGTTTLSGTGSTLSVKGANTTYAGIISGVGNLSHGNNGTLTLTGANSVAGNTANIYTGNTIVDGGTMAVDFTTAASTGVSYTVSSSTVTQGNVPNGSQVVFTANAPGGAAINTTYYVVNSTATTYQVATTPGGTPITFTGANNTNLGVNRYDRTANIINNTSNSSALLLTGGTFQVKGGAAQANSQQFNGLTLSSPSGINLTTSLVVAQGVALNVGAVTRNQGGVLLLTNPTGTLSATNGLQVQTTSASGAIITTTAGTPYVVVNGADWGKKNAGGWVEALAAGDYTANGATTLSGNANIVGTDTTLAAGGSATSIRFNDFAANRTITVSGGTLTTGGVLVTNGANASAFTQTITGGTLQAAGAGEDLVLVENNTQGLLTISSAISDNGGSGLATAGPGTITLNGANSYTGKTSIGGGLLNLPVKQAFYGGTVSAATAGKVTVDTGATLGLNVGGAGQFTAGDVGTLLTNATFKASSALALDTSGAGGTVVMPQLFTNTAGGQFGGQLGLTKNGTNDLQLAAGNNTYSGPTTINKGFVRLQASSALSGDSAVTMGNDASAGLDLNGNSATISSLAGGAAGSTLALGTGGTLNIISTTASGTSTFNGQVTGSGVVNFNFPTPAAGNNNAQQVLGGVATAGGVTNLNVTNGNLTLSAASAGSVWGSASTNTGISNINGATAVLTVGANTTLASNFLMVGGDPAEALYNGNAFNGVPFTGNGGLGTLNVNVQGSGTTSRVNAATLYIGNMAIVGAATTRVVNIGTNAATGVLDVSPTVELTGTTYTQYGIQGAASPGNAGTLADPALATTANIAIAMATNNNNDGTLNIAGANTQVKIENNSSIVMGRYYSRTATITQSGGNVKFYSDGGSTVGGTGKLIFDTDNPANTSNFQYQLNAGTLTVNQVLNAGNAAGTSLLLLNGGTLAVGSNSFASDFITGQSVNGTTLYTTPPIVRIGANGGTIDVNGFDTTIKAGIFHTGTPAIDGGLTVASSTAGGVLELNPTYQFGNSPAAATINLAAYASYTGPTTILSGATLKPLANAAVLTTSGITVNAGGKYDVNSLSNPSLAGKQTLSGGGTITGAFSHQIPTATISPGSGNGLGTTGTLTFDTYFELVGGKARFDLSNDAVNGSNDQIVVSAPGSSFAAQASPSTSIIQAEFTGSAPAASSVYHLVSFPNGNFFGSTQTVTFFGNNYDTPTGLTLFSSGTQINGRDALLAVNTTTKTLDLIFHAPAVTTGTLIWTGGLANNNQNWDTNNNASWNNTATLTNPDKFFSGDNVTFDNTAAVPHTVLLTGGLAPGSVTVNSNAGNDFTFDSTTGGKISGGTALTKNGTSTLTIKTANDFTGGTTITQGSVVLLDAGSGTFNSGLGIGAITIGAGTSLQVGNGTAGLGSVAATTITNNGSMTINRPDAISLSGVISGPGTLTVQGGGTGSVTLTTAGSNYTGNTTITGSTLIGGTANALPSASLINISNVAGSALNTGGFNQAVIGISGGGATGGSLTSPGGGTLTFTGNGTNAIGTNTFTFAGTVSLGTTGITVNGALTNGLTNLVQNFTGSSITYAGGGLNVNNGTLNISPSAPSAMGATGNSINVGTANLNNGAMTIGVNATYTANNMNIGGGGGTYSGNPGTPAVTTLAGNGVVNTSGIVNLNGSINFANGNGLPNATLNITGGTLTLINAGNINMGTNGGANQHNPNGAAGAQFPNSDYSLGYRGDIINISGSGKLLIYTGTVGATQSIFMGQFFNNDNAINQNGGTVAFVNALDGSVTNDGGELVFRNNNALNFGTNVYNLNGGSLTLGQIHLSVNSFGAASGEINNRPLFNFNGGTLRVASGTGTKPATFFNRNPIPDGNGTGTPTIPGVGNAEPILPVVQVGGGTIDANGRTGVAIDAAFAHDPALGGFGLDGGLNFNDSGVSTGDVTLTGAGGTFNGGAIVTRGKVIAGADAIASHAVSATGTTSNQVVVVPAGTTALSVGEAVTGPGIPDGTVIAAFSSFGVAPIANGSTPGAIRFGNITLGGAPAGSINVVLSNPTTIANGAGASLTFGASSPLGTELVMNGGTFASSAATRDLSAATTLKTTANSTVDLAGGTLKMAQTALTHWANNSVLTIANPTGGHLFVGSGQTLNYNQLANITFSGSAQGAVQLATGEVVPGTPTGTFEKLGDVDHNTVTDAGDIGALATALSNLTTYTNNLTLDSGWSSKAAEAIYLADVKNDDRINNLDLQGLIVYLANGGNGSNAPGGGSLTAVPEPSTWVLLAIGGLVLGGAGRRGLHRRKGSNVIEQ